MRRALSEDEFERFLAAADADDAECAARLAVTRTIEVHGRPARHAARQRSERVPQAPLWRALLTTAARWGELTRVTWLDLDADQRALTLRAATTKSGRARVIPRPQSLVDELLALRAVHQRVRMRLAQPEDRVFLSLDGADWADCTTNGRRLPRRVLDRAGVARRGVPLVVAQRVLGHASPEMTTKVYTHPGLEDVRRAVDETSTDRRSSAC